MTKREKKILTKALSLLEFDFRQATVEDTEDVIFWQDTFERELYKLGERLGITIKREE